MQITRAGEYGVLGLMNLARRNPGQMAMIDEVSRAERIPKSFLAKIFQDPGQSRAGPVPFAAPAVDLSSSGNPRRFPFWKSSKPLKAG